MFEFLRPNAKNPVKLREILIATGVGLIMLVLGALYDFKLTSAVFQLGNESWFGIIGAAIVELPVCIGLGFGGASLIFACPKTKKARKIVSIIVGAAAILVSYYFIFDTFDDIHSKIGRFYLNEDGTVNMIIRLLAIAFAFIMEGLIVGLAALGRFKWNFNQHDMFVLGIFMILIAGASALASNFGKYIWSRPRPRYIFAFDNPEDLFHAVWVLDPLKSFKEGDNFKSFPSGHTVYAATGMFFLPYIAACSPKLREDRRILVILFYIGLAWTVLAGLSRVYAGAHFLSDTAAGMGTTLLVGTLLHFLLVFRKPKEKAVQEEQPQQ